jgi:predicted Zn finger-like uncharacterized protein
MQVSCPRCSSPVDVDESQADANDKVRLRCGECGAKILIQVNRPELKVDDALVSKPPRRLQSLDGLSIERDELGNGEVRSLVVARMPEEHLADFRLGLKGTGIYGDNPNKLNWLLQEPPYELDGLTATEANEIEAWVREVGGVLQGDEPDESDDALEFEAEGDETLDEDDAIVAVDDDIAAELSATFQADASLADDFDDDFDDDISVEDLDDPDASLVPFQQLDGDAPVTTQNRLEGLDQVLGLVSGAVRLELVDVAGPDPAAAIERALDEAKDRLLLRSAELGADGVVAVRMHQGALGHDGWVVVLTGTAVRRG